MQHWFNSFFSWFRTYRRTVAFISGLCLVLAIAALPVPVTAQSAVTQGTIAEILDGSEVYIQSNPARVNDVANRGQQIRTGTARAQVDFNTGAIARLSTNSVLTVGQCAQLQRGTLLVNGAVNGCTSSITAGVRGTTYVLSVDEDGREQVRVLEGEVTVARGDVGETDNTSPTTEDNPPAIPSSPSPTPSLPRPGGLLNRLRYLSPSTKQIAEEEPETVVLMAGQRVSARPGERLGRVEFLTVDDFIDILTGQLFDGFVSELPGVSRIRDTFRQLFPGIPFPLDRRPGLPLLGL